MNQLFTCAAGSCGTSCAGIRGGAEVAASSPYSERREEFLDIFTPAGNAGDIFFFSYRNESFKLLSAFFTNEFIYRHWIIILRLFFLDGNPGKHISFFP